MFFIAFAVKHIANNNYLQWFKKLQLRYQPLHIFFKNSLRYSDAGFSEMACFT